MQALTVSPTTYCEIHDHNLGFGYNLTQLSPNNKEDIVIKYAPNETIRMQLCSPLTKKCNNQDGYAICLITDKTEKGIGNYSIKHITCKICTYTLSFMLQASISLKSEYI